MLTGNDTNESTADDQVLAMQQDGEVAVVEQPEAEEVVDDFSAQDGQEIDSEEEVVEEDVAPSKVEMSAQVYRRIAECLEVELAAIDRQIARAEEISVKDGFFTRWKTILDLKRSQCVTALEKARASAVQLGEPVLAT
jgi:hypothetical protein